ncbi:hypothetical protein KSL82_08250 [Limosilactobacillus portuensis]|uniref:Uncharacterized protein n=1 Tax=Limosilactobacillus portuensis TaxID=2742601 RepID=A0ABS6IWH2_9LACO|nr:hypothetical protein [Limosilactobacillus portuensis]MBU9695873.1 hypothetical protein [Limosilactobacillus portuensis]
MSRGLARILVACLVSNFTFSQNWVTSLILVPLTLLGWWGLPKLAPVIDRLTNRQVTLLVDVAVWHVFNRAPQLYRQAPQIKKPPCVTLVGYRATM